MKLKSFCRTIFCICIVGILFSNCENNTPDSKENWISLYNGKGNWEKFNIDASKWENKGGLLLKEGYIALQAESHNIDFKNLRLLNLRE